MWSYRSKVHRFSTPERSESWFSFFFFQKASTQKDTKNTFELWTSKFEPMNSCSKKTPSWSKKLQDPGSGHEGKESARHLGKGIRLTSWYLWDGWWKRKNWENHRLFPFFFFIFFFKGKYFCGKVFHELFVLPLILGQPSWWVQTCSTRPQMWAKNIKSLGWGPPTADGQNFCPQIRWHRSGSLWYIFCWPVLLRKRMDFRWFSAFFKINILVYIRIMENQQMICFIRDTSQPSLTHRVTGFFLKHEATTLPCEVRWSVIPFFETYHFARWFWRWSLSFSPKNISDLWHWWASDPSKTTQEGVLDNTFLGPRLSCRIHAAIWGKNVPEISLWLTQRVWISLAWCSFFVYSYMLRVCVYW